jgi:hypothetical protein
MKTITILAASAATAAALAGAAALAKEGSGRPITVAMTGTAERPGPGDPDGSGTASFRINPGQGQLCYTLTVANIDPATAAHIHRAPPTDPGPVVVPLAAPTSGSSQGCVAIAKALAHEIVRDPGAFYVNVHNTPFGPGAIRGQLGRTP